MGLKADWKIIALPLAFLGILLSLVALWKALQLPSEEELIAVARQYFDRYGYGVVFVSALIEGMLLLGLYYPGSFVIFLGVILAGQNIPRVGAVVLVVTLGLLIAYLLNYLLGKYGWYRLFVRFGLRQQIEKAQARLARQGPNIIFVTYWHPNFAALTAAAAGILHLTFIRFLLYSVVAALGWNTFWAALIYWLGEVALELTGIRFAIIVIIAWTLFVIAKRAKLKNAATAPNG